MSNSLDPDKARYFVGPDLGPNCLQGLCLAGSGFKLFAKVISGQRVKNQKLVDTTVWLRPWLKLISFGYNLFQSAKVLATTNSEPELALNMYTDSKE